MLQTWPMRGVLSAVLQPAVQSATALVRDAGNWSRIRGECRDRLDSLLSMPRAKHTLGSNLLTRCPTDRWSITCRQCDRSSWPGPGGDLGLAPLPPGPCES